MKVRGFQVAPAELEGCILDHPDVADTCVVPVPDDYSGEVPLAFVVLHASAAARVGQDPRKADVVKASIMKVRLCYYVCQYILITELTWSFSMSQTTRSRISV
jgi:acyl-coenzyme A synthetase/AMP-(fatty) acid ligase